MMALWVIFGNCTSRVTIISFEIWQCLYDLLWLDCDGEYRRCSGFNDVRVHQHLEESLSGMVLQSLDTGVSVAHVFDSLALFIICFATLFLFWSRLDFLLFYCNLAVGPRIKITVKKAIYKLDGLLQQTYSFVPLISSYTSMFIHYSCKPFK